MLRSLPDTLSGRYQGEPKKTNQHGLGTWGMAWRKTDNAFSRKNVSRLEVWSKGKSLELIQWRELGWAGGSDRDGLTGGCCSVDLSVGVHGLPVRGAESAVWGLCQQEGYTSKSLSGGRRRQALEKELRRPWPLDRN